MIYDYANQYWDHLFNDGPTPAHRPQGHPRAAPGLA